MQGPGGRPHDAGEIRCRYHAPAAGGTAETYLAGASAGFSAGAVFAGSFLVVLCVVVFFFSCLVVFFCSCLVVFSAFFWGSTFIGSAGFAGAMAGAGAGVAAGAGAAPWAHAVAAKVPATRAISSLFMYTVLFDIGKFGNDAVSMRHGQ